MAHLSSGARGETMAGIVSTPEPAHTRRIWVAVLALAALVSACGSGGKAHQGANSQPSTAVTASDSAGPQASTSAAASSPAAPVARASTTTGPGAAPGASTSRQSGASSSPPPHLPVAVTVGASCVQRGHTQSLHVHTVADALVVYDNIYSDGKDGGTYGGRGASPTQTTDAQGNFDVSWVVLPTAPNGPVKVAVGVVRGNQTGSSQDKRWIVATLCGG
jgi:hypothetical protein